jgi:hypothetical protein
MLQFVAVRWRDATFVNELLERDEGVIVAMLRCYSVRAVIYCWIDRIA